MFPVPDEKCIRKILYWDKMCSFKFPIYKRRIKGGFHLWINCWQLSWFPGINWDMVRWKFYRQSWPNNTTRLLCYSYPQTNSWWWCCIDIPWHLQGKKSEDWEVYEFRKSNCISLPRNKLPTCDNYLHIEWNIFIWIQWADQWFIVNCYPLQVNMLFLVILTSG